MTLRLEGDGASAARDGVLEGRALLVVADDARDAAAPLPALCASALAGAPLHLWVVDPGGELLPRVQDAAPADALVQGSLRGDHQRQLLMGARGAPDALACVGVPPDEPARRTFCSLAGPLLWVVVAVSEAELEHARALLALADQAEGRAPAPPIVLPAHAAGAVRLLRARP